MSEKKFRRIRMAIAIGVGLALIPAAMFAATAVQPIDGLAGVIREQATATVAATAKAAPKSGTGGALGQESSSNTMTIVLLVAAVASIAVTGRMVTRRR
ncbi:MAG: hypothetical protein EXR66_03115 [Dehalococcoidia bacterium]|nr:hypothetical protein [Dehalococcoidia bacterium]